MRKSFEMRSRITIWLKSVVCNYLSHNTLTNKHKNRDDDGDYDDMVAVKTKNNNK